MDIFHHGYMFVCGCMKDDVGVVESCLRLHTVTVAYITYDRQDGAVWKSFLQLHIYFVSGGFRKIKQDELLQVETT